MQGGIYLSQQVLSHSLNTLFRSSPDAIEPLEVTLTDRELVVYELLGAGLSISEIAASLHVSSKTIESNREQIKHKLKLPDAAAVHKRAIQWVLGELSQEKGPSQEHTAP